MKNRKKSLALALALSVVLSTSAFAAPRRVDPRNPDFNPIEWVVRAVRKIVHTFDQPVIPIPSAPSTNT